MGQVVRFAAPRTVEIVEEPEPKLGPGQVRLRTLYSGVSAGTELTAYTGTNPYLTKRWDPDARLFAPGSTSIDYPTDGWGYEEIGEIVEVGNGVRGLEAGQRVWGIWGHRTSTVQDESYVRDRLLPAGANPLVGVFSHIGSVALNAVLDAEVHLGETVVVFGLGVAGQLAAQFARLNGARVIGVDLIGARLDVGRRLGADEVLDASEGRVAERVCELTHGRGADVCIEASGAYPALHEAIRAVSYGSRVVAAGFYQGEGTGLALGEEFHHNRVQLVCSQISSVAPHLRHRWDRYRLQRTVMDLATSGRLEVPALVTHVIALTEASRAFRLLDESPEQALQVVLQG